jgi:hypothetical protein
MYIPEPSNLATPDSLLYSFTPEPRTGAMAGGDIAQSAQRSARDEYRKATDKGVAWEFWVAGKEYVIWRSKREDSGDLCDRDFALNVFLLQRRKKLKLASSQMHASVLHG